MIDSDRLKEIESDDEKMDLFSEIEEIASTDICYFDENGDVCEEAKAVSFIATSYDKDGNRINETWGSCNEAKQETSEIKL